jgi:CheY-like chemotaxis protein
VKLYLHIPPNARKFQPVMKLLIVEDNARMRRMIRQIVSDCAEQIFECEDGAEASTAYAENRPDWVLMDIEMNKTDGLTAARQIRSEFADAKIIFVTNYDDAAFRDSARETGTVDYILKENLLDILPIIQQ